MRTATSQTVAPPGRPSHRKTVVIGLVCLLSAWGAVLSVRETPVGPGSPLAGTLAVPAGGEGEEGQGGPRLVYPYSVIPGGVTSAGELEAAVENDPVVREHYRGFNLRKVRVETLEKDRYAYVSYRVKGNVYWTKNKLRLAQGEKVLTDGVNVVRARCGNRVSDAPMAGVSLLEPPEAVFDSPVLPAPLRAMSTPPPPVEVAEAPPIEAAPVPAVVPVPGATPGGPGAYLAFLGNPLGPGGAPLSPPGAAPPPGGPGAPPPVTPPVQPPPPSTPPGTPPGGPPGTPPTTPPVTPPAGPPGTPPSNPPGSPPGPPPTTPPGGPPAMPPTTPPGLPPGTPSAPPPLGPPGVPPSTPPTTPPVEPPAPPPSVFEPPSPEGPFPPGPPPPSDPPGVDPPDPLAPPDIPPPPPTPIPEPSTYAMMAAGLALLVGFHRRRRKRH